MSTATMETLPTDCFNIITNHLNFPELCELGRTCKRLYNAVSNVSEQISYSSVINEYQCAGMQKSFNIITAYYNTNVFFLPYYEDYIRFYETVDQHTLEKSVEHLPTSRAKILHLLQVVKGTSTIFFSESKDLKPNETPLDSDISIQCKPFVTEDLIILDGISKINPPPLTSILVHEDEPKYQDASTSINHPEFFRRYPDSTDTIDCNFLHKIRERRYVEVYTDVDKYLKDASEYRMAIERELANGNFLEDDLHTMLLYSKNYEKNSGYVTSYPSHRPLRDFVIKKEMRNTYDTDIPYRISLCIDDDTNEIGGCYVWWKYNSSQGKKLEYFTIPLLYIKLPREAKANLSKWMALFQMRWEADDMKNGYSQFTSAEARTRPTFILYRCEDTFCVISCLEGHLGTGMHSLYVPSHDETYGYRPVPFKIYLGKLSEKIVFDSEIDMQRLTLKTAMDSITTLIGFDKIHDYLKSKETLRLKRKYESDKAHNVKALKVLAKTE